METESSTGAFWRRQVDGVAIFTQSAALLDSLRDKASRWMFSWLGVSNDPKYTMH